jgi:hypothetical protein
VAQKSELIHNILKKTHHLGKKLNSEYEKHIVLVKAEKIVMIQMLIVHQNVSPISWPAFADAGYNTLHEFPLLLGSSEAKTLPKADEQRNGTIG